MKGIVHAYLVHLRTICTKVGTGGTYYEEKVNFQISICFKLRHLCFDFACGGLERYATYLHIMLLFTSWLACGRGMVIFGTRNELWQNVFSRPFLVQKGHVIRRAELGDCFETQFFSPSGVL
uniref:Uncharacterized protein n=1 Tax=Cacopsylla melanoneura TaxID=428564 RepID=A0A8D9E7X2_9HEMI